MKIKFVSKLKHKKTEDLIYIIFWDYLKQEKVEKKWLVEKIKELINNSEHNKKMINDSFYAWDRKFDYDVFNHTDTSWTIITLFSRFFDIYLKKNYPLFGEFRDFEINNQKVKLIGKIYENKNK